VIGSVGGSRPRVAVLGVEVDVAELEACGSSVPQCLHAPGALSSPRIPTGRFPMSLFGYIRLLLETRAVPSWEEEGGKIEEGRHQDHGYL
jgi:hypothetical protein